MFKLSEIKELMKLMDQTSLQELEIANEGTRLFIRKSNKTESIIVSGTATPVYTQQPAVIEPVASATVDTTPAKAQEPADLGYHTIVAPMVGTFYSAASPGAAQYVSVGSKVSDKTIVCILEAMKLMNPIEAEIKGEIVDILVENGQLVEYGQPLFLVKPE
ncbi:acetyl-CoA carboxylase biotin carboxyl carrier protein [Paenibacillus sp. N1-5-1-14]|uniref:acetyl-CoA carboxylase biotin carboxyl carrier protein n=1 Tax=Paenibacillus radicibacter TaxID=2972488 RepID=UPI00215961C6|nr:acetyl-CoA carboxylase biotin carboxyl carrier protein [Paenibacillus radicibacter]MCR8642416.1 acetyl-CoA carboxylase biotin carboxyl carrier protein [Paenibacillus radicibacter]